MKKITFLLMIFALAWNAPLKAIDYPEASKNGKVKWYFLQSKRTDLGEPRVYTAVGNELYGYPKAEYSDYETLAKQLWCFETEDGEWYTITNRYDGRKLGVGLGSQGECPMLMDEPQAKFKIRKIDFGLSLMSNMPAPGGGNIFLYPSLTGEGNKYIIWLIREQYSYSADCGFEIIEYNDTYVPQNTETVTWYNITSAEDGTDGEIIVDNTSIVDAQYKFTVEKKDPNDQNAQWRLVETNPGKVSIINRATGNSISTSLTVQDKYNVPTADDITIVPTGWSILPVSEGQYVISSVGKDNIQRMLNSQIRGDDPNQFPDEELAYTKFSWIFTQADTQVGIEETSTKPGGKVYVENGHIIAPEGAKVNVITPEGIEIPADTKLVPGIYIVTVNGKTSKILVH